MRLHKNKSFSIFVCLCFLMSSISMPAFANEDSSSNEPEVASIKKGEPAPFDGTLFNATAAARLISDLETSTSLCKIETEKAILQKDAEHSLKIDIEKASYSALKFRCEETIKIRESQILYLEKRVEKPKIPKEVSFALGVLSGVALTIGSAYVIHLSVGN